jgi:hypothetical protein
MTDEHPIVYVQVDPVQVDPGLRRKLLVDGTRS